MSSSVPLLASNPLSVKALAFIAAVIAAIFIGASPIFVRLSTVDPLAVGFFRFFFALPVLFCWMLREEARDARQKMSPNPTFKDHLILGGAGVFFAIDTGLWHLSLAHTTVVNATLLNNMTPIFVTLFTWIILRQPLSIKSILGIVLAIGGTFILVLGDQASADFHVYGDSLAGLSAVFFAGYVLLIKHLRQKFNAPTIMFWSSLSCMYALALMTFGCETTIVPTTWQGWLPLIGLGIVVHSLGQGLVACAMRHITALLSSVTMLIVPIVSALIAWVLFNESLTLCKVMGGIIVLIGIIVARQNER